MSKNIKEYFDNPAISQSFLKNVLDNNMEKRSTRTMNKGSLLDLLTTCPEDYDLHYKTVKFNQLSDKVENIFKELISKDINLSIYFDEKPILEICKKFNYYNGEKRALTELLKEVETFKLMYKYKDFELIQPDVLAQEQLIADRLRTWIPFTYEKSQVSIFENLDGIITKNVACKGLLDYLCLENELIIDLKRTTVPLKEFVFVAKKFRYALQASFYCDLVHKKYGIMPDFSWLVYSSVDDRIALFNSNDNDLDVGRYGNTYTKGYMEAIDIYTHCTENKYPDWDIDYHRNSGVYDLRIYR